jgi:hypothetical protein
MAVPTNRPPARLAIAHLFRAHSFAVLLALSTLTGPPLWWQYIHNAHKVPITAASQHSPSVRLGQAQTSNSSPAPAQSNVQVLDVPANAAVLEASGGFDTRISLQRNQQASLQASGSVFYGYDGDVCSGTPRTSPDGRRTVGGRACGTKYDPQVPAPGYPVGSLLWRVGPTAWQEVGNSMVITAPTAGDLYLGINDDTIEDNQGSFIVSVKS